ncbi:hypothetical protein EYC84_003871 [Monilinia fructicola]|uniref:Uncharacterized protein n=1 Tax=Monilinia fructicola TaxID=38448 RepID=A0A5M9K2G3_MONFR|nr:hypothetical protein EYC84_003871 [Monilinia fructicola]
MMLLQQKTWEPEPDDSSERGPDSDEPLRLQRQRTGASSPTNLSTDDLQPDGSDPKDISRCFPDFKRDRKTLPIRHNSKD